MKKYFMPVLLLGVMFTSCSKDDDINEVEEVNEKDLTVETFIHRAMADWYLYEAEVPALQEAKFNTSQEKKDYLASFDSPEALFKNVKASHDRFSFMWSDYSELEDMLYSGIEKTTGIVYAWGGIGDGDDVFVITRYVLPNSSAEQAGLKRGDLIMEVDGQQLTRNNFSDLLSQDQLTVSLAKIEGNTISLTGETADLSGAQMAENPVHLVKTFEIQGLKIGYLMYNGFTHDFDPQLNEAFGYLKSENIDELIIDLRYNGGGSVETASDLSSMITGGFEGEILAQMQLNKKWQKIYETEAPDAIKYRFNDEIHTEEKINSLGLGKVHIIATFNSASASELLINGLEPYIDVIHIGSNTAGKYQSSRTLYDSSNIMFSKTDVNSKHKYVVQPLIAKIANANGKSDYDEGLTPDFEAAEGLNYLPLGDPEEPLLKATLNVIFGTFQEQAFVKRMEEGGKFSIEGDSKMQAPTYQRMYTEDLPMLD